MPPWAAAAAAAASAAGSGLSTTRDSVVSTQEAMDAGIHIQALGSFYQGTIPPEFEHCLVVNYSGLKDDDLDRLADILSKL